MKDLIDLVNKITKKELNRRKREARKEHKNRMNKNLLRFFTHDNTLSREEEAEAFNEFVREIENVIRPNIRAVLDRNRVDNAESLMALITQQDNLMDNYNILVRAILSNDPDNTTGNPSNNNNG